MASHRLELLAGLGSASARDDLLVPLAFTGPEPSLGVRYGYASDRHAFDADLRGGFGLLWNRFGHLGAELWHGIGAGYDYALSNQVERLLVGGAVRLNTEVAYLATWDDAHGYGVAMAALWPRLTDVRPLGTTAWLESRAQFALLGLAARPPAYRHNKQDPMIHVGYFLDRIGQSPSGFFPWDVQAIELEALARFRNAERPLGQGFGLGLCARFLRASDPDPYARLYLGVLANFGFGL